MLNKKKKMKRLIEKKIIIFYNNHQFLLFSFVFLKTFFSFQTLFLATQQSKTNGLFGLRGGRGSRVE